MINKQLNLEKILEKSEILKKKNVKIGFANGCFDLLHPGHISLIKESKKICDYLIIGLNSDSSVKNLKGDTRPIDPENLRIEKLSKLNEVDAIIVFSEDTPIRLLSEIKPDFLIKGSDYKGKKVAGSDVVIQNGGKLKLLKYLNGFSTTKLIQSIED